MEDIMVSNPFDDPIDTGESRLDVTRAVTLHLEFILSKIQEQMDMAEEEYKDSGEDEDFGAFRALKELKQYITDSKEEFVKTAVKYETGHTGVDFASNGHNFPPITAARGGLKYTNTSYIAQAYTTANTIISPSGWNGIGNI